MSSAFWLAALAYLLPTFPLGYFWHLRTFKAHYDRLDVYREQVIVPMGLATMIMQALMYAWVYPRLVRDPQEWVTGAMQFGVFFGALAWSLTVLPAAAKYRMSSAGRFIALETLFTLVHYLVVSPLIALAWRPA